ncbi:MAG: hypothetical protein WCT31_02510 [Candidatus Micrarchaeia archaeon]|jgi:hypothetical protein
MLKNYFLNRRRGNEDIVHRDLDFLKGQGAARTFAAYAKHVSLLPAHCSLGADVIDTAREFRGKGNKDPENLAKAALLFASVGFSEWHSFREMVLRLLSDDATKGMAVNAIVLSKPFIEPSNLLESAQWLEANGLPVEAALFYKYLHESNYDKPDNSTVHKAQDAYERMRPTLYGYGNGPFPIALGTLIPFDQIGIMGKYSIFPNLTEIEVLQEATRPQVRTMPLPLQMEKLQKLKGCLEWMTFLGAYAELPQSIGNVSDVVEVALSVSQFVPGAASSFGDMSKILRMRAELAFMNVESLILAGDIKGALKELDNLRTRRWEPQLD